MTVRSIVQMFEGMAASTGASSPTYGAEAPGRECVYGLVSYYNGLAVVEDTSMPVSTKTHVCNGKSTAAVLPAPESSPLQKRPEASQSNQESSEAPAAVKCSTAPPSPPTISRSCSLPASRIPPPKPREYPVHQQSTASSVRKVPIEGLKRTRTSSSSFPTSTPTSYHAPPTPVAARLRSSCTSYAAFVAKIESSQSRLLDFEKDERWIGQVEVMKGRVEALKRKSHIPSCRELAGTPRKSRSTSECSIVSTASTASLSSTGTQDTNCQPM